MNSKPVPKNVRLELEACNGCGYTAYQRIIAENCDYITCIVCDLRAQLRDAIKMESQYKLLVDNAQHTLSTEGNLGITKALNILLMRQ